MRSFSLLLSLAHSFGAALLSHATLAPSPAEMAMFAAECRRRGGRGSQFGTKSLREASRCKPMQRDGLRERNRRLRQMGRPQLQAA